MLSNCIKIDKHLKWILIGLLFWLILVSMSWVYEQRELTIWSTILILIPACLYLFIYHFELLFFLTVFFLPSSIHLNNIGLGIGLSIPGELMISLLFIGIIWRIIFDFNIYKNLIFNRITLVISLLLAWTFLTSITSVLPTVSLKFFSLQFIYIVVFYFFSASLLNNKERIIEFISFYVAGFIPVIIYTITVHYLQGGLKFETANSPCYPFYNDHTIYASCIAMIIPLLLAICISYKRKLLYILVTFIFILALYYAFSRAGMLSFALTVPLFLIIFLSIRFKKITLTIISVTFLTSAFLAVYKLSNNQSSSNFTQFIKSFTDSKNNSNNERLNRWSSAWEMFEEKPLVGFGPGTYQFAYSRYQNQTTEVSVFDSSMGGAHSEYLKPLSEQGILGLFFEIALLIIIVDTFLKNIKSKNYPLQILLIGIFCGICSSYIHGVFNYFLDTDKAACLFWGFVSIIANMNNSLSNTQSSL